MPYVSEKLRLSEIQDRRRKLTTEDQEEIQKLYATGMYSWKQLAVIYKCSKSRIGQIVNPERAAKVKARGKEHWRDYRPSKEEWSATIREHRHYKQELYLKGELTKL
jgi:DNA invertase Pin-like site-specific DNA recombinase